MPLPQPEVTPLRLIEGRSERLFPISGPLPSPGQENMPLTHGESPAFPEWAARGETPSLLKGLFAQGAEKISLIHPFSPLHRFLGFGSFPWQVFSLSF